MDEVYSFDALSVIDNGSSNTVLKMRNFASTFNAKRDVYWTKREYMSVAALPIDGNKDLQWGSETIARAGLGQLFIVPQGRIE